MSNFYEKIESYFNLEPEEEEMSISELESLEEQFYIKNKEGKHHE